MVDVKHHAVDAARRSHSRSQAGEPHAGHSFSPEARVSYCIATLAFAVAVPALILGGALPLVALLGAALSLLAFLLTQREERPAALPWVFLGLAAYSLLQVVPLPLSLLRALSPNAARIWERGAPSEVVRFASLSLDPGATALEAVKWCSYAATLVAAAWLARRKGQIPALLMVFGTALTVSLVWVLHASLELDALYGVYKPRFISHMSLAPFLNRNNLAGYLGLGFFSGLGLAYQDSLKAYRPLIATGTVTLLVALLMARSTGGTAATLAGFGAVIVLGRSRWKRSPQRLAILAAIGIAGVAVTALAVPPEGWLDLGKYSKKLVLFQWSLPLVRDFFLFGTGRGAFETVFPAYRKGTLAGMPNQVVFTHPENLLIQWAGEWGIPVALVAACAIMWLLLRGLRRRSVSLSGLCVACGIGTIALHNLVDLSLELSGVGIAVALLLGTVLASPGRTPTIAPFSRGHGKWFLAVAFAIMGCSLPVLYHYGLRLAWQERDAAYEALLEVKGQPADNQSFFDDLRKQARHRPAEPYFALIAAQGSQKLGLNAMPWIGRAIERDPTRGETYLVLARELGRRGRREQALGALRLAIEQDETLMQRSVRLAHAISSDADELVRGVPQGQLGTKFLLNLAASSEYELRSKLVKRASEMDKLSPLVLAAEGRLLSEALNERRPECVAANEAACIARVEEIAKLLQKADAAGIAWLELSSQILAYQGRSAEAVDALRRGCKALREPAPCLRTAVILASDSNNAALVDSAISDFLQTTCVSSAACARGEADAGRALMRVGSSYKALEHYQRSAEIQPSVAIWRKAAEAARAAGLEVRAKAADRRAARLGSGAAADAATKQ